MSEERDTRQFGAKDPSTSFEASQHSQSKNLWTLGPVISQPDSVIKAPSKSTGIVRALHTFESGRASLHLKNESDIKIRVDNALCLIGSEVGRGANLLRGANLSNESIILRPGEDFPVDVTEALVRAAKAIGLDNGILRLQILLVLEPEPAGQPGPGSYVVVLRDGRVEEFKRDGGM